MVAFDPISGGRTGIAPTFWPLPTAILTGSATGGGVALINSVGNLSGLLGPYAMGLVQDRLVAFRWDGYPSDVVSSGGGRDCTHTQAATDAWSM